MYKAMAPDLRYTLLPHRALLRVSGADAVSFLQGLITNDARKLEKGEALYALLLTPQGKFLHDFFLYPEAGGIYLDVVASRANDLLGRLKLYRLRSKVEIEALAGHRVAAVYGEGQETDAPPLHPDPRLAALGLRGAVSAEEAMDYQARFAPGSPEEYDAWRLHLGVPEGLSDLIPEKSLPMEYGLDRLNAIDFAKGCYVGQEVTARMRYRATIRKRLMGVRGDALPEAGAAVTANDAAIGEIRSSRAGEGLALVNAEALEKAKQDGAPLRCGAKEVQLAPLAWNMQGNAE